MDTDIWMDDPKDCFHRYHDKEEQQNALEFVRFAKNNPSLVFYWPNRAKDPWHMQSLGKIGDQLVEMNFWPHKSKAQFENEKAIKPFSKFVAELIKRDCFYGNGRTSPPKTTEVKRGRPPKTTEVTAFSTEVANGFTEVTRGRYPKTTEVIYGSKPPYPLHTTSVKTDCRCDDVWELCAGDMSDG